MQDYDSIEAKYFERNSRAQWSEWHEWWYNPEGKRINPDRWRLWIMWEENQCSAYVVQLRNTRWVRTILRKMLRRPKPFELFSTPVPESSDQSPGFHHKKSPASKKAQTLSPASKCPGSAQPRNPRQKPKRKSRHRAQSVLSCPVSHARRMPRQVILHRAPTLLLRPVSSGAPHGQAHSAS